MNTRPSRRWIARAPDALPSLFRRWMSWMVGLPLGVAASACTEAPAKTSVLLSSNDPHACSQLEDADVDLLSAARGDLEMRSLTYEDVPGSSGYASYSADKVVGVEFAVAARPGWTVPLLQRRIECYRTTGTADESSPLATIGTDVSVRSSNGRFFIAVTSPVDSVVARVVSLSNDMATARMQERERVAQGTSGTVATNVAP